jgi:hypothetical protein
LTTETLCEILDAAHLSKYVETSFQNRGGLLVIAPPGSLKDMLIEYALEEYPNALVLSDLNINTLMKMRDDLVSNRFATMAFPEFAKLYARDSRTSANIEFTIQQLVDEGFRKPSFADPRMASSKARLFVIGGMVPSFYETHYDGWQKSGFLRRFISCVFSVENPEAITNAIKANRRLGVNGIKRKTGYQKGIPLKVSEEEANYIHRLLKEQPDDKTPLMLMMKIFSVLKWKYEKTEHDRPKKIFQDFAPTLRRDGGRLIISERNDE